MDTRRSDPERTGAAFVSDAVDIEAQTQPNGVELTLSAIWRFLDQGAIGFDNEDRRLPETEPIEFDSDGWAYLPAGAYKIRFNETVTVPHDRFAIARPRSSLLRMGVSCPSALWDSGFTGKGEGLLVVHNPFGARMRRNARLVQLVFFELEEPVKRPYDGGYQNTGLEG